AERKISMGHARALISLENSRLQISLARQIIQKQLPVRDVEKIIHKIKHPTPSKKDQLPDPDLMALQEELIRLLGTKVSISGSQKKGVIKIHYFSTDDLNRFYEKIKE
ncbi:MAG: hypothetical protein H8E54_05550, partial [Candidatus Aminicenantes bacterium]|nr:hypothetical protein [Candidatus Aminicenantes bacterium]